MISLNVGGIVRNGIGNTEINEFQLTFDQDEVGRFEIRMNNFLLVYHMHGLKHLSTNREENCLHLLHISAHLLEVGSYPYEIHRSLLLFMQ